MCSDLEGNALHVFTWTVKNYSACSQKSGNCFTSPAFLAESLDKTTWFVKLYRRGDNRTTKEFVSCFLYRCVNSDGPDEIDCYFCFEVIDENKSLEKRELFKKFTKGSGYGLVKLIENSLIFNKCSNDTFTLKVSIRKKIPKLFTQNSCCTKIVTDQFSFKWKVKKSLHAVIKPISFSKDLLFEIIFKTPDDDVEISIRRIKGFAGSQILKSTVTLMDLKGKEGDSKEAVFEADEPDEIDSWIFPNFLKISKITDKKEKYLEDDYFTLKVDFNLSLGKTIDYFKDIQDIEYKSLAYFINTKENPSAIFKKNLKRMFSDHVHTDVELCAGEEVIRAHKVILCASSPIFLAMFNQDMAESQSCKIKITDVEAETLNTLLEFMYTGDTEITNYESALKLLLAADKYQILSLIEKCSSSLELLISEESACDILFAADLVQQETLKVSVINFIKGNSRKIFRSKEWKQLAKKNLELATETVCEVSSLLLE